jgi:hypothetical protein
VSDPLSASEIRERATQLSDKWQAEADRFARLKDSRDDPYDDRGFEYQTRATVLRACAVQLLALLASRETP